jgi:hypothetical protein
MVGFDSSKYPSLNELLGGLQGEINAGKLTIAQAAKIGKDAINSEMFVEETIVETSLGKTPNVENVRYKLYDSKTDAFKFVSAGVTSGFPRLFISKLREIKKRGLELAPVLKWMKDDFFATNKDDIFNQKAAGDRPYFKDLKIDTVQQKRNLYGSPYPILVDSGELMFSLTDQGDPNAISEIAGRQLVLGTRVPYAKYHQQDFETYSKFEPRPPVQINPPGSGRLDRWMIKLNDYVMTGGVV